MEHARACGLRELHVWDDHFATDRSRAKAICRAKVDAGLRMPLNLFAGLRVDSVDQELMLLLKQAGCYSVAMAPETGTPALLETIQKGITLDDSLRAYAYARRAGLETIAYFMLGLPGETAGTVEATIRFAIELSPTYAKACFATPLPGTKLLEMLEASGHMKTRDWSQYAFHKVSDVYDHPSMSWDELQACYCRFYHRYYLRPRYVLPRVISGIRTDRIVYDVSYALKTWFGC